MGSNLFSGGVILLILSILYAFSLFKRMLTDDTMNTLSKIKGFIFLFFLLGLSITMLLNNFSISF